MSYSTVLLGKPKGPQTVKNEPSFLELNVHYRIDNCMPFCLNPIHASLYNLVLFYHQRLCLPSVLFLSSVLTKNLHDLLSSIRAICPPYLITFG